MRIFSRAFIACMFVILAAVTTFGFTREINVLAENSNTFVKKLQPSPISYPLEPIKGEINEDMYSISQCLTGVGREEVLTEKEAENTELIFVATAYCPCEKCCGKTVEDPAYGITASGYNVLSCEKNIVAADTNVLPLGSQIKVSDIDGNFMGIYYVEDIGGAIDGNRIDVFHMTHYEAEQFGIKEVIVEVLYKPDTN